MTASPSGRPPVRILVAGAGLIGRAHIGRILADPDTVLAGIADPSPGARDHAAALGVPWFETLEQGLDGTRPDAVILATPNQLHVAGGLAFAAAGVPVLVDSQASLPSQFETLGARLDNAARLQRAGVQVAIMGSRDFNNLRQARVNAGLAVAYGLPREAAIASVTAVPARIWGQASAGTLEPGKDADVVLWNGDPLETTSWPLAVFIDGVEQPQTSRAFELRDRYARPNPNGYPPAYQ